MVVSECLVSGNEQGLLQSVLANLTNNSGSKEVQAHILFDTGSSRTFITRDLCDKLALSPSGSDEVSMAGFGDYQRSTDNYPRVNVHAKLPNGALKEFTANVVDVITCPIQRANLDSEQFPILTQIQLADPASLSTESMSVDILMGIDYYYQFIHPGWSRLSENLFLLKSEFGYIPTGITSSDNTMVNTMLTSSNQINEPQPDLKMFWELEQIGISDPSDVTDEDIVMCHFNNHVCLDGDRYCVSWPWREQNVVPPDNYQLALGRLKSLMKRLAKTPELVEKYNIVITDQLVNGIIEEVQETDDNAKIHYLPHHTVVKESSETTKLRVVFDASAKTNTGNLSLNDCLHKGPSFTPDLCGIFMRFRLKPVALLADVEKAFLQIGLAKTDRDVTRFLW